jgi:hypothetical protein
MAGVVEKSRAGGNARRRLIVNKHPEKGKRIDEAVACRGAVRCDAKRWTETTRRERRKKKRLADFDVFFHAP